MSLLVCVCVCVCISVSVLISVCAVSSVVVWLSSHSAEDSAESDLRAAFDAQLISHPAVAHIDLNAVTLGNTIKTLKRIRQSRSHSTANSTAQLSEKPHKQGSRVDCAVFSVRSPCVLQAELSECSFRTVHWPS